MEFTHLVHARKMSWDREIKHMNHRKTGASLNRFTLSTIVCASPPVNSRQ